LALPGKQKPFLERRPTPNGEDNPDHGAFPTFSGGDEREFLGAMYTGRANRRGRSFLSCSRSGNATVFSAGCDVSAGVGNGGQVRFQPGARSAWHTHPLGQILIVTDGVGWVQQWGGPVQVIRKGDVVWIPAGVKHWHGATPTTTMTHIAFQEQLDGTAVNWLEKVIGEQYRLRK